MAFFDTFLKLFLIPHFVSFEHYNLILFYMLNITKILLILFTLFVNFNFSYASTIIKAGDLDNGGVWDKQGSPYILYEDVYLPDNFTLYIDEGVTVMSASSSEAITLTIDGDLKINGTIDNPVLLDSLREIYLSGSEANIQDAILDRTSLSIWQSTTSISNSIIKNNSIGIKVMGSKVDISTSKLIDNNIGLVSYPILDIPVLVLLKPKIAHADNNDRDWRHNSIYIFNSTISGNKNYGLQNLSNNIIEASNNWWGSDTGPRRQNVGEGDKITDLINFDPWKTKDPDKINACCSDVIFIPGIEASRLYSGSNTLWEPNRNADVIKLYLDETGQSINNTIYTKDIIDNAFNNTFNIANIYKSFIAMMNSVVAEKYINSWLPFPYDWRLSIEDIVYGNTKLATTTASLIDSVIKLSNNSKNGKVTIVAHSNGGLIAKMLLKALDDIGKSDLIDQIITIGTPELGTPQAIPAILHGYQQSILNGFLLSENIARNLSKFSLGALGLLPSKAFFEKNKFDIIVDNYSIKHRTINNYDNFIKFLTDNSFSKDTTSDITIPITLNSSLLNRVESIHESMGKWSLPSTTRLTTLLGWGIPTTKSLFYEKDKHCKDKNKRKCKIDYNTILTSSGDGTVITNSVSDSDSITYINLRDINSSTKESIEHANILESSTILDELRNMIMNTNYSISNNQYFTNIEPVDNDKWLTIKIYSPVEIHIYDEIGRHTGLINETDQVRGKSQYEKSIPLSYYADFGNVKMVSVPLSKNYEIILEGSGTGVFTLDAQISQYDKVIATTSFEDVPVTPLLNAQLLISSSTLDFASSTELLIDANGDGVTEYIYNKKLFKKKINKIISRNRKERKFINVDSRKRF